MLCALKAPLFYFIEWQMNVSIHPWLYFVRKIANYLNWRDLLLNITKPSPCLIQPHNSFHEYFSKLLTPTSHCNDFAHIWTHSYPSFFIFDYILFLNWFKRAWVILGKRHPDGTCIKQFWKCNKGEIEGLKVRPHTLPK